MSVRASRMSSMEEGQHQACVGRHGGNDLSAEIGIASAIPGMRTNGDRGW